MAIPVVRIPILNLNASLSERTNQIVQSIAEKLDELALDVIDDSWVRDVWDSQVNFWHLAMTLHRSSRENDKIPLFSVYRMSRVRLFFWTNSSRQQNVDRRYFRWNHIAVQKMAERGRRFAAFAQSYAWRISFEYHNQSFKFLELTNSTWSQIQGIAGSPMLLHVPRAKNRGLSLHAKFMSIGDVFVFRPSWHTRIGSVQDFQSVAVQKGLGHLQNCLEIAFGSKSQEESQRETKSNVSTSQN